MDRKERLCLPIIEGQYAISGHGDTGPQGSSYQKLVSMILDYLLIYMKYFAV